MPYVFNPFTGNLDSSGSGDVVGPPIATDDAIVRFDGTSGVAIQNSSVLISDAGAITGAASIALAIGATIDEFSTDGTLAGNSDTALPTEKAVKTYVDNLALDDLTDVVITSVATGQIVSYNGSDWVNSGNIIGDAGNVLRLNSVGQVTAMSPHSYLWWQDDFLYAMSGARPFLATTGGANSASRGSSDTVPGTYGAYEVVTGTDTNGGAQCSTGNDNAKQIPLGNGKIVLTAIVYIPTLADATDDYYVEIGSPKNRIFSSSPEGVFFRYDRSNSVYWRGICRNTSSETLTSGTDVTVTASAVTLLDIVVNADATSVEFFVNNVSIGTVTTNIPALMRAIGFTISKTAGTNTRKFYVDYMSLYAELTNPRV